MLEDIGILTGGKMIAEELGIKLENVTSKDLGRAKKVIIDKDNTTIVEGAGKKAAIEGVSRKSARRSRKRLPIMIKRSCKSGWPSSLAGLPSLKLALLRKSR